LFGVLLCCFAFFLAGCGMNNSTEYDNSSTDRLDHSSASRIIVYKEERELELYFDSECIGTYKIALGSAPEGDKNAEGDMRTPEGEYYIITRHNKTDYGYFMGISYPNVADAQRNLDGGKIDQRTFDVIKTAIDKKRQPPWDTVLGGAIGIHGGGNETDWTEGCVALSMEDLEIVKGYAPLLTPVIIYGSRNGAIEE
jgi:murein L,D-transpeptidase YafK